MKELKRQRPKMREKGMTHFIQIPLVEQIGDTFESQIKPQIQNANLDTDVLVDKNSLHITLLAFRMRSIEDVPKWEQIIKSINYKKAKIHMKGVDIFPVKKKFTRVVFLNINGLDDIIDGIISKGISEKLIN